MLRSMGAELESLRRGAVEFAENSFEWLRDTVPHAIVDSAIRMKRTAQEKGQDFNQWAVEGYNVRQRVIYTDEDGFRISAVVLGKELNDQGYVYEIKIVPGTYFMGDMRGVDTTGDGVQGAYFREQAIKVLHRSLRKVS